MSKIAAEAAREINREIANNTANYDFLEDEVIAAIIERALSQSLAARDKEIEELIKEWRSKDCDARFFELSGLAVLEDCAVNLEALLKGKAI